MEISETYHPKDQSDWRNWLEKNHEKKREIWLVFYKKNTGKQSMRYQEALDEALCFGWIDGMEKSIDSERYTIRFSPRSTKSGWSTRNVSHYKELLKEGRVEVAGIKAFDIKSRIYNPTKMKKGAADWHLTHKMPKSASRRINLEERIAWHRAHQKYCGCRPIPKSLSRYL